MKNLLLLIMSMLATMLMLNCRYSSGSDTEIYKECIEGHVYYRYYIKNGYNAVGLTPKLHDNGTPVKCNEEDFSK